MRYAVVDGTGTVTNIVEWDGVTAWAPPTGTTSVKLPDGSMADIGWTYNATTQTFTSPV